MDSSINSNILNFWQSSFFDATNVKESADQHLRVLLGQLIFLNKTNKINGLSTNILYDTLTQKYAELHDKKNLTPDEIQLTNADLNLSCSNKENEADQWKSCLNFETLNRLSWFQKFIKENEKSQNTLFCDPNFERSLKIKYPHKSNHTQPVTALWSGSSFQQQDSVKDHSSDQGTLNIGHKRKTSTSDQGYNLFTASTFNDSHKKNEKDFGFDKESESIKDEQDFPGFLTARDQLSIDLQKKCNRGTSSGLVNSTSYGTVKKSLGTRRGPNSRFIPPILNKETEEEESANGLKNARNHGNKSFEDVSADSRLKNIDPKMIELIRNEIMDCGPPVLWDDIAGLEFVKNTIKEIVIWPMLRPDIFTGLRGPPKGILLFGPPGTGKTLIGKCIASQSKATFFSISSSCLTSKWIGEGEKMVKALFAVARTHQPSVIFIDEIDSLLTHRTEGEHEATRRIKTEFLVQLDGAAPTQEDRLLVIGATNRPQEIDEAARRRFVKRLYIPLPNLDARKHIVKRLLSQQIFQLSDEEFENICQTTEGYSGADMANVCREAALGPIRSISFYDIQYISPDQVRPITYQDFVNALHHIRPSVSEQDLNLYIEWNIKFGCRAIL